MLISRPLPFVRAFVDEINTALKAHNPACAGLSAIQRRWLSFCLMAIMLTQSICWARFERAGLGRYSQAALSWMFRRAKLPWEELLQMSVRVILRRHGMSGGVLGVDDTDNVRTKVTSRIAHVHKLKDKASGGFVRGQSVVFLLLVSATVTLPVGFAFYEPDPLHRAWVKQDKALKAQGVCKRQRPPEPPRNPAYPTKAELALRLLAQFKQHYPTIPIKGVLADALYGTATFIDTASAIFGGVQVISQLRSNQKVRFRNRTLALAQYFARYPGVSRPVRIRGGEPVTVIVGSARLYVQAQGKKRFVIALKYEGETDYRYLVASELTWRTEDIVQTFTLRWLVEVFFEDWKVYEGWAALTKQPGAEGSSQSLILSLLVDHCLLLHPDQLAQLNQRQPAFTVGSLINRIKVDSVLTVIRDLLAAEDPERQLQQLADTLAEYFGLRPSEKHMVGRDLGRLEPSPSLKYKGAA
jgi:DDE superfamily endonuclease